MPLICDFCQSVPNSTSHVVQCQRCVLSSRPKPSEFCQRHVDDGEIDPSSYECCLCKSDVVPTAASDGSQGSTGGASGGSLRQSQRLSRLLQPTASSAAKAVGTSSKPVQRRSRSTSVDAMATIEEIVSSVAQGDHGGGTPLCLSFRQQVC